MKSLREHVFALTDFEQKLLDLYFANPGFTYKELSKRLNIKISKSLMANILDKHRSLILWDKQNRHVGFGTKARATGQVSGTQRFIR